MCYACQQWRVVRFEWFHSGRTLTGAHVELSAKDAGLDKALFNVQRRMQAVAKVAAAMALAAVSALTAIAVAAGGVFVNAFKSAVVHMDKMQKSADRLGTSTDKISALGYAAEQSGAEFEQLESAAKFLQRNLETNAEAFTEFGLSAEHLKTLGLDEQMIAVADAISTMPDATRRTAAAMALLGRGGTALLPLFKDGGAGLRALLNEAGDVGAVIDPIKAREAERIGDAIDRAWKSIGNTIRSIGASAFGGAAGIEALSAGVVDLMKEIRRFATMVSGEVGQFLDQFSITKGIKNALAGGSLKLAFQVGVEGIKSSWATLMLELEQGWLQFEFAVSEGWHRAILEIGRGLHSMIRDLQDTINGAIANLPAGIRDRFGLGAIDLGAASDADIMTGAALDRQRRQREHAAAMKRAIEEWWEKQKGLNKAIAEAAELQRQMVAGEVRSAADAAIANAVRIGAATGMLSRPGLAGDSGSTAGSFSTFAAQQALGVGTVGNKIEMNTRNTANGVKEMNKKLDNLENEFL